MKSMCNRRILLIFISVFSFSVFVKADEETNNLWERDSVTDGFWGLNDALEDDGIQFSLSLTQIYQQNLQGGLSTHRRQGRHTGSYDLELWSDFEKLLGVEGGRLYIHAEGGWSRKDIDETSVGSLGMKMSLDTGEGSLSDMESQTSPSSLLRAASK